LNELLICQDFSRFSAKCHYTGVAEGLDGVFPESSRRGINAQRIVMLAQRRFSHSSPADMQDVAVALA
jgi:hypothetical protein